MSIWLWAGVGYLVFVTFVIVMGYLFERRSRMLDSRAGIAPGQGFDSDEEFDEPGRDETDRDAPKRRGENGDDLPMAG